MRPRRQRRPHTALAVDANKLAKARAAFFQLRRLIGVGAMEQQKFAFKVIEQVRIG
ncbi:hypothetical protein D3C84_1292620 [compost metagenome]